MIIFKFVIARTWHYEMNDNFWDNYLCNMNYIGLDKQDKVN